MFIASDTTIRGDTPREVTDETLAAAQKLLERVRHFLSNDKKADKVESMTCQVDTEAGSFISVMVRAQICVEGVRDLVYAGTCVHVRCTGFDHDSAALTVQEKICDGIRELEQADAAETEKLSAQAA